MTTSDVDLSGFYADGVASGLGVTQDTLLDGVVAAGTAYISQALVTVAEDLKTFTISVDTYVDVGNDGVVTYTEVAIDDPAPALAADAIRLAKVTTDGTTIVSITDLSTPVVETYVFGTIDIGGGSTMEIYNDSGRPVRVRHGSGSTSEGIPLAPFTSKTVTETVYVKPTGSGAGNLIVTK
jgi:hypothetical protein